MTTLAQLVEAYPSLGHLPDGLRADLEAAARPFTVPSGTVLFDLGMPCSGLALLLAGGVEVSRPSPGGREILLYRLVPGDTCVMTVAALTGPGTYEARATTTAPTTAIVLPKPLVERLLSDAPAFRAHLLGLMASRLNRVVTVLEATAFAPVEQRLARHLLEGGDVVATTHQHLAEAVGSVREVVSRHLSAWAKEGWVEGGRGTVRVRDRVALSRIAEPFGAV